MKKLRLKNSTCVIISVAMAIIIMATLIITNPAEKIIKANYPTEDAYSQLKEYSLNVAKALNPKCIEDTGAVAKLEITDNCVVVEVKSLKQSYSVISHYPFTLEKNDELILLQIDYEEAKHQELYNEQDFSEQSNKLSLIGSYIMNFMWSGFIGLITYWIISKIFNSKTKN